jgi:MOSC domain-containing protein YiiM
MNGVVLQLNASRGGIPKRPILEARVTREGIDGDSWNNRRYHGGPKQALLLISIEDIEVLKSFGYAVYPGALGENLTVSGIPFRDVRIGDRFQAGEVVLEITKLRKPCRTLDAIRKGIQSTLYDTIPGSELWGRGGFYASILQEGLIRPGDTMTTANVHEG